jgi:hypothetical protein
MLAVKALGQSSLSPVVTDVRGPLHDRHWAEICFNLLMSKPNPLRILDWSSDRNWWITAFVGLSDLYVKGKISYVLGY